MNLCVISDCLKLDITAVHCFISTAIKIPNLKSTLPSVEQVKYFSDGVVSQYKNYKNFSNLCMHKKDHGIDAEWHQFTRYFISLGISPLG